MPLKRYFILYNLEISRLEFVVGQNAPGSLLVVNAIWTRQAGILFYLLLFIANSLMYS